MSKEKESQGKLTGLYGVILLVASVAGFLFSTPVLMIVVAIAVIAGCAYCFINKCKGKILTIIALIFGIILLFYGFSQAKEYGLFKNVDEAKRLEKEEKKRASEEDYEERLKELTASVEKAKDDLEKEIETITSAKEDKEPEVKEEPEADKPGDEKEPEVKEPEKEEEPEPEKEEEPKTENGVDPELKAFLDSYEAFMDEYVEFMKKYSSDSGNVLTMALEYTKMFAKYEDFANAAEAYDQDSMSEADLKYYIEVNARINKKLLEIK